jgi:hypothetical protein
MTMQAMKVISLHTAFIMLNLHVHTVLNYQVEDSVSAQVDFEVPVSTPP